MYLSSGETLAVGSYYRPPGSNNESLMYLSEILSSIASDYLVLGGDFNLPDVTWRDGQVSDCNSSVLYSTFSHLVSSFGLIQHVTEPTRADSKRSSTLDLLFCNSQTAISSVTHLPGISDLADELFDFFAEFEMGSYEMDVDNLWKLFRFKLIALMDTYIPNKVIRPKKRSHKPWIDKNLRRLLHKKQRAYLTHRRTPNAASLARLRNLGKLFKVKLKIAKRIYHSTLSDRLKRSPKEFWKLVKSNKKDQVGIPPIDVSGQTLHDGQEKATCFSRYFQSVFSPFPGSNDCPAMAPTATPLHDMKELVLNSDGLVKLLQSLNPNKSTGPDGIPNRVLRECSGVIAMFLYVLFTKSLSDCTLPSAWKEAYVVPVHKNGPRNKVENYRPISLLSTSSKLMEHVIYTSIVQHLNANNFFTPFQHGFRPGLSCTTQMVEFFHELAHAYDKGLQTDCIFLDFRKAFDLVPHKFILHKLSALKIPPNVSGWLVDYLRSRTQAVVINGKLSDSTPVTSGVPQGSVLGPLLFLIFINDIVENVSSSIRLYADDCVMYRAVRDSDECAALQEDIDRIASWCFTWGMELNVAKCHFVRFTKKQKPVITTYNINSIEINLSLKVKYLGVYFSHNLSWNHHIEYMTAKANRMLGFIRRNFKDCPREVKNTLYLTYIRPILEYASELWDPYQQYLINDIESIQNRSARFVLNSYNWRQSVTALKEELKWELLQTRRKCLRLKLLHAIHYELSGIDKGTYLLEPHFISQRRDHSRKIRPFSSKTDIFKHSFFPSTIQSWNELPEELVLEKNNSNIFQALLGL